MTYVTSRAPIAVRRLHLSAFHLPRLAIGATLGRLFSAYGRAMGMAYVDPYRGGSAAARLPPETDPEGRDPNW